jgi:S-disulfanyl-L-cysteine oxidoreductase SoxD
MSSRRQRLGGRRCRPLGLLLAIAVLDAAEPSVWDGVYTAEQARRGETAYLSACASCHGTALEGGDMTPPLVGGAFTSNWNDLTVGDLFERIRTTMPLDMPGKLSRQQNADAIAFILKANGWPSGAAELATDLATLRQIRIAAVRPDAAVSGNAAAPRP